MKFLKTFLFTISFLFIFGSIMSLCGYCQALPSAPLDPSSFEVLEGGMNSYSFFGSCPEMLPFYIDQVYSKIDNDLYFNTGYDIEDYCTMAENEYIQKIDEAGFGSGNPSGGLSSSQAQWLANRFTQGLNNGVALGTLGYSLIKQAVPQFGQNAKAWFLGKYDEVNNKFTDVCNNFVVKMTSDALQNYSNSLNNLVQNNDVVVPSNGNFIITNEFRFTSGRVNSSSTSDSDVQYFYFKADKPLILFNNQGFSSTYKRGSVWALLSVADYQSISFSGYYVSQGAQHNCNGLELLDSHRITINGIEYIYGEMCYRDTYAVHAFSTFDMGRLQQVQTFLNSNSGFNSLSYLFNYSSSSLSSIKNLLSQLVGYYVDNNSINQINTIIREIPIVTETINNVPVPVAEPSLQQLDDLQTLIDEIKILSANYEALGLNDALPEPEPEPDPEPVPNNQGTEVPEDFPTTILSPINDSVGGVFDFVSIFEPLFYIFSFSAGLLGLWFVVPFVILFMILFRLLK